MEIAVLIIFFNKLSQTIECIRSFLPAEVDIYVLNNGSPTNDFNQLKNTFNKYPNVHLLQSSENLGPAGGRNFLIRNTHHPWLFFVDNDITIKQTKKWTFILNEFLELNQNAQIICPRIFNIHEEAYMDKLNISLSSGILELKEVNDDVTNFFPEGGAIVSREVFKKNGFYDENLFAFEGYDFALRSFLSEDGPLQAHHIVSIDLIHDHRYQKLRKDKDSVRERYSNEKIQTSLNYLKNKHQVTFDHNWQWWSRKQARVMTERLFITRIKQFLSRLMK